MLNRFGWIFYLLLAIFAATMHIALLAGDGRSAYDLTRYPLLAIFVTVCVVFVRFEPRSAELQQLHATAAKRVFWGSLLVIWLAYTALIILANLGYALGASLFGDRLSRLWYTSAEMWVFAFASALLRIRSAHDSKADVAT
jgi:hypothetical protein